PRVAGHGQRSVEHRVQGGRRPEIRIPRRNHLEVSGVCQQRALLHPRCGEASGWPRAWRADPSFHRPGAGVRCGGCFPKPGRAQVPARERARPRLRRPRGRMAGQYPQGQAGAQCRAARRGPGERGGGRAIAVGEGELVASIGENRKMVIFSLDQVPEMTRGRGVRLQRYKDGGLSDLKTFGAEEGLSWTDAAGRAFSLTLKELADWRGNRADAGRLAPKGFPRTNTFKQMPANGMGREGG